MPINVPRSLRAGNEDDALAMLGAYYAELSGTDSGYTGGVWDTFDPDGNRAATANEFTTADVVSCALLATPIPGRAAVELVDLHRDEFARLLEAVGPDRDFVDVDDPDRDDYQPVRDLYEKLRKLPGIGETRATKLLARKRPRLVPIVDSVVKNYVFGKRSRQHWAPLHAALRENNRALHRRLVDLHTQAELDPAVSPLRVFDVLAWWEGSGKPVPSR